MNRKNDFKYKFKMIKMGELYKLNKDELIQIIFAVKESINTKEMKNELKRRKELKELNQLKTTLLNLKVIPHLTKAVEKYEDLIKNGKSITDIMENSDLKYLRITEKTSNLEYYINSNDTKISWIKGDKIVYKHCKLCTSYEVLIYKKEYLISVYYSYMNGVGFRSEFVDSTCRICQN